MGAMLDDEELTIPFYSEVCNFCKHIYKNGADRSCKAFDEIPMDIWIGKNKHTQRVKGDNGITFERVGA